MYRCAYGLQVQLYAGIGLTVATNGFNIRNTAVGYIYS